MTQWIINRLIGFWICLSSSGHIRMKIFSILVSFLWILALPSHFPFIRPTIAVLKNIFLTGFIMRTIIYPSNYQISQITLLLSQYELCGLPTCPKCFNFVRGQRTSIMSWNVLMIANQANTISYDPSEPIYPGSEMFVRSEILSTANMDYPIKSICTGNVRYYLKAKKNSLVVVAVLFSRTLW